MATPLAGGAGFEPGGSKSSLHVDPGALSLNWSGGARLLAGRSPGLPVGGSLRVGTDLPHLHLEPAEQLKTPSRAIHFYSTYD